MGCRRAWYLRDGRSDSHCFRVIWLYEEQDELCCKGFIYSWRYTSSLARLFDALVRCWGCNPCFSWGDPLDKNEPPQVNSLTHTEEDWKVSLRRSIVWVIAPSLAESVRPYTMAQESVGPYDKRRPTLRARCRVIKSNHRKQYIIKK